MRMAQWLCGANSTQGCRASSFARMSSQSWRSQPVEGGKVRIRVVFLRVLCHSKTAGGVSGSADEGLVFWGEADVQGTVQLPKAGVSDVVCWPDGRVAFVGGWDGVVRVYKCSKRAPLAYLRYHCKGVTALALHPADPTVLVSASRDHTLAVWVFS